MTTATTRTPSPKKQLKRKLDETEAERDEDDSELLSVAVEHEKRTKLSPSKRTSRKPSPSKKPAETVNKGELKKSIQDENKQPPNKVVATSMKKESQGTASPLSKTTPATTSFGRGNDLTPSRLIQPKLAFKSLQANSPKSLSKQASQSEEAATPAPKLTLDDDIQNGLVDPKWKKLLEPEFEKGYFTSINKIVKEGYKKGIVRPPKELIFNAFNSTKIDNIKVVIIGQDPYHDDGQAHGLCFSVPKGIALPPSLRNIFKELKEDIPDFERDENLGGYLQKWTTEGVFLLNAFLTVEAHKAGSHSKIGWGTFTDTVIKIISEQNNGCVFLMWGNFAQQKESLVDKKKHCIIKCAHPSPLSMKNFFGSKCFSKANTYLKSIGKNPVNWSLK